jgi:hypothetical protein
MLRDGAATEEARVTETTTRGGRRRGLVLLASVLLLVAAVVTALVADTGARDDAAPVASVLGPAAGEAVGPMSRWWFTSWPVGSVDRKERALGRDHGAVAKVPAGAAEREPARTEVESAPIADAADVFVEPSDVVALRTAEGFDVAAGGVEFGSGPTVTYTVELEPAVDEELLAFTAAVEQALGDPRSWARQRRFVRVDDPAQASVRIVLATPATVDRLCGAVGLQTVGRYSCWTGTFAALNAWRWMEGASAFEDLTTYRRYLVNHEVGHALGFGHVGCPRPGDLAPVMMQQSIRTEGCVANGWPFP